MRVSINLNSKEAQDFEALQYLTDSERERLTQEAVKVVCEFENMRLGDFIHAMNGDFTEIGIDKEHPTVAQYLWVVAFAAYINDFVDAQKSMQIAQNEMEKKAGDGCPEMDFEQSVMVFCQEYFKWDNFDLNRIQVWEYLLAKKASYARGIFQKNYDALLSKKYAKK